MPETPDGTSPRNWIVSASEVLEAVATSPEHADEQLISDALTGIAEPKEVSEVLAELESDDVPGTGTLTSRAELRYRLLLAGAEFPDQNTDDVADELSEQRRQEIREQVPQ